jgi:hypothetical protein
MCWRSVDSWNIASIPDGWTLFINRLVGLWFRSMFICSICVTLSFFVQLMFIQSSVVVKLFYIRSSCCCFLFP